MNERTISKEVLSKAFMETVKKLTDERPEMGLHLLMMSILILHGVEEQLFGLEKIDELDD